MITDQPFFLHRRSAIEEHFPRILVIRAKISMIQFWHCLGFEELAAASQRETIIKQRLRAFPKLSVEESVEISHFLKHIFKASGNITLPLTSI